MYAASGLGVVAQALRPFPQYTREANFQMRDFEGGDWDLRALQVSAQSAFLSFLASYTWSKTLTNSDSIFSEFTGFTQDYYTRTRSQRKHWLSTTTHSVLSYHYELPFGPGKKWLSSGGAMGKILGGWSVAGIRHGSPQVERPFLRFGNFVGSNSFLNRPNVVPGVEKKSAAVLNGTSDPTPPNEAAPVQYQCLERSSAIYFW